MLEAVSPVTFNTVAGASIIVAIIVSIGREYIGNPNNVIINISDIVPPPIGTAVTRSVASSETASTLMNGMFILNKLTKNIILNTLPIIEPSLWKFVPRGITVLAISSLAPAFFADSIFTGMEAAEEQVDKAVIVAGNILFQ